MAILGLKNLSYAVIESENKEATTYGEVKDLGPAISFGMTPEVNSENLSADDAILFTESSKGATAIEINTAFIEAEVEAELLGKTLDSNGGILDNKDDTAPYIAIGGQAKSARGGYEWFWVYRVKLTPGEDSKQTEGDTPEFQTPILTGEALPRLHDGSERYKLWDKGEEIEADSIFSDWFEKVIDADWTAGA